MTRNKLALMGLSALALVAISAFAVTGAQAEGVSEYEFTCLEEHVIHVHCEGDGEEATAHYGELKDHIFEAGLADITCHKVKFDVTTFAEGTSVTAPSTPTYEECTDMNRPGPVSLGLGRRPLPPLNQPPTKPPPQLQLASRV